MIQRKALLIIVLAIAVRLTYLALILDQGSLSQVIQAGPDARDYYALGTSFESSEVTLLLRAPGYPAFLYLLLHFFHGSVFMILTVQALIGGVTAWLAVRIVDLLLHSYPRWISACTGITVSVLPTLFWLSNALLAETLFIFLFALGLFLTTYGIKRDRVNALFYGMLAIGGSALVKPIAQFFPVVWAFMLWMTPEVRSNRRTKKYLALASLAACFLEGSWVLRNFLVNGVPVLSASGAYNAACYQAALVQSVETGKPLDEVRVQPPLRSCHWDESREDVSERLESFRTFTFETFRNYPATFIKMYLTSVYFNVVTTNREWIGQVWVVRISEFMSRMLHIFVLIGITILGFRKNTWGWIGLAGPYFYFALLSGVNFWQGSRVFAPSALVWPTLVCVALYETSRLLRFK